MSTLGRDTCQSAAICIYAVRAVAVAKRRDLVERVGKSKGADIISGYMKNVNVPDDMDDESLRIPVNGSGGRSIRPTTRKS